MRQLSVGIVLALALGDVQSQDGGAAKACTRLDENAARLACYDAALGYAAASSLPKSRIVPPPLAPKPEAQPQFGDEGQLHKSSKAVLPKNLTAEVKQVVSLGNGLYRLTLDSGQVWQTTEADWQIQFKVGSTVTISRRVLGGYLVSLAGYQSVGAKRTM